MTLTKYSIYVRNGEIPITLVDNGFFYNRIHTNLVRALEKNHPSNFKTILVSFSAKNSIVVDHELTVKNTFL